MTRLIASIDAIIWVTSLLAALLVLFRPQGSFLNRGNRVLLGGLLFFTLVYGLCLFIEWSKISARFDKLEDVVGALLPMAWAFLLYGLVQQMARRDLKESDQKLRAIFNQTFQFTGLLDLNGLVLQSNRAALESSGVKESDVLGRPFWETIWWSHSEKLQRQVRDAVKRAATGEFVRFEATHPGADGGLIHVDFSLKPVLDEVGEIVMLIPEGRDITERKLAEEERAALEAQLLQARKMEAIGTLAGGIAHDFNNLLSAILGFADLAKDDAVPGSACSEDLEEVLKAGFRAKDLVHQILAFSRQSQVEKQQVRLQTIVHESIKMLRSSIPTTIEIQESISEECGAISADPSQMNQVLLNLCTNAFHAMEENGGVLKVGLRMAQTVPVELRRVADESNVEFLELSVSDTGHGISADIVDRIFEPFFSTKGKDKGTGMGLAITYGIIADSGGTIAVDSQPGEGTSFRVYLPQSKQEINLALPETATIPGGRERILFVDDEEVLAVMNKRVLEKLGYRVTAKQRAVEALEAFRNQPDEFDLVITDYTMPGMTGIELARSLLLIRSDIPIILCTGHSASVDEDVAKAHGIKAFAIKPVLTKTLDALIRQVSSDGGGATSGS